MEIVEFVEMNFLRKRLKILEQKRESVSDEELETFPDFEFTFREVRDIDTFISTLMDIRYVYGGK
jgi:hypothetical protein